MNCFVPSVTPTALCCSPVYAPTQADDVRNCLYQAVHSTWSMAIDDWLGLEEFGVGQEKPLRKAVDLAILQEYLMDLWHRLEAGESVATIWTDAKLACVRKFFRCTYGLDITNILATVGLYDTAYGPPGANVPSPA